MGDGDCCIDLAAVYQGEVSPAMHSLTEHTFILHYTYSFYIEYKHSFYRTYCHSSLPYCLPTVHKFILRYQNSSKEQPHSSYLTNMYTHAFHRVTVYSLFPTLYPYWARSSYISVTNIPPTVHTFIIHYTHVYYSICTH